MPKILDRVVRQLSGKGVPNAKEVGVAAMQKAGNLKPGSTVATAQGIRRGNMTPDQRAKARRERAQH